jgi:hypothetical protein
VAEEAHRPLRVIYTQTSKPKIINTDDIILVLKWRKLVEKAPEINIII